MSSTRNAGFQSILKFLQAKVALVESNTPHIPINTEEELLEDLELMQWENKRLPPLGISIEESIQRKLSLLEPDVLKIKNLSADHAGHASAEHNLNINPGKWTIFS